MPEPSSTTTSPAVAASAASWMRRAPESSELATIALEETILTEIVANSLDSGARRIQLAADAATAGLVVVDDGSGMRRRELARYHDIASSAKTRGQGIGFAGVGIKLGLLVC